MKRLLLLLVGTLMTVGILLNCGGDDGVGPEEQADPPRLYVVNQEDGTIYIYNASTLDRLDSFPAGINLPHSIQFSPDSLHYYVTGAEVGGDIAKYLASDNSLLQQWDM